VLRSAGCCFAVALSLLTGVARAQPAQARLVTVHLDAPTGTELRGRPTARDPWSVVCTAPCDRSLDRRWLYSVVGSGDVGLAGAPAGVAVRVAVTPPPPRIFGHAVIVTGAATYVAGEGMSIAWIVGLILHATGQPLQPWVAPLGYVGTSVAVGGLALVVAGALYNAATREAGHVELTWQPPPSPRPDEVEPRPAAPPMPVVDVPLLSGAL
jgi:hypothetical protein